MCVCSRRGIPYRDCGTMISFFVEVAHSNLNNLGPDRGAEGLVYRVSHCVRVDRSHVVMMKNVEGLSINGKFTQNRWFIIWKIMENPF